MLTHLWTNCSHHQCYRASSGGWKLANEKGRHFYQLDQGMDLQERGPCETHKTGLFESTTEPKDTKEITMSAQLHGILFNQVLTKSPRKAKGSQNFKNVSGKPRKTACIVSYLRVVILDLLHLSQHDKKAKTTLKMQHLVAYFSPLTISFTMPPVAAIQCSSISNAWSGQKLPW